MRSRGVGAGSPPWVVGAIAATVSQGKYGSQAASAPPRDSPARIENATATPAPTRNGQPGVLRIRCRLRISGGPAASSSTTTLIALQASAERFGSTRAT